MNKSLKFSNFTVDAIVTAVISAAVIIGVLYWQTNHKDIVAGYTEGTEGYSGYMFAKYNDLKSKDECEYAKLPEFSEFKTGGEFMRGCHKYFE